MSSLTRQLAALAMSAPLLLAQSLRLTDGGVERDYVIATDEVHLSGPKLDRVVRVDELGTAKSSRTPGTRLETVIYPGHAHGIAGRKSRLHLARTQTDFFKRHLMIVPRQP